MLAIANIYGFIISNWRIVGACVLGLVVLLGVLLGIDTCSNWRSERQIDKAKANVNIATKEVANAQIIKIQAEANVNAAVEKVKETTNAVILAANASAAGQKEVNQAITNLQLAVNADRPVDINAADLEKRLNDLGVQ